MFSVVMLILQLLRRRLHFSDSITSATVCHLGNFFQNNRIMNCLVCDPCPMQTVRGSCTDMPEQPSDNLPLSLK